jgi:hypothetical protein
VALIIAVLRQLLDPHGIYPVVLKKPIGDYIRSDAAARRALFAVTNRAFQHNRLNLKPGDLARSGSRRRHRQLVQAARLSSHLNRKWGAP